MSNLNVTWYLLMTTNASYRIEFGADIYH